LTLDAHAPAPPSAEDVEAAVRRATGNLSLREDEVATLVTAARLVRYGPDEIILARGTVPQALSFVSEGQAQLVHRDHDGGTVPVARLDIGEPFGESVLSRTPAVLDVDAVGVVTILELDRDAVDRIVLGNPDAARRLQGVIDLRTRQASTVG